MAESNENSKCAHGISWLMAIVGAVIGSLITYALIQTIFIPPSRDLEKAIRLFHDELKNYESAYTNYYAVDLKNKSIAQPLRDAINPYSIRYRAFKRASDNLLIELQRKNVVVKHDLQDLFFENKRHTNPDLTASGFVVQFDVHASSGKPITEEVDNLKTKWNSTHNLVHIWLAEVLNKHDKNAPDIPLK